MRGFYFLLLFVFFENFCFGQCTVPGSHNGWQVPGWSLGPHTMSGRGEYKVHCGTWPDGQNGWYLAGNITFENNGGVGRAFGDNPFSICAPGAFSGWNNNAAATQIGNQWCFTIPNIGTYDWKPTVCGSWDSWEPSGQRSINSANWTVTTTSPNQQVCITYNSATGVAEMQVVLPVFISTFNVYKYNSEITLTWTTSSETNNDGFAIERSSDGISWEVIGFEKGHGNSSKAVSYTWTDAHPKPGINYYRLRQLDFDGRQQYSEVKQVFFGSQTILNVSPNPFESDLLLQLAETATVEVLNTSGKMFYSADMGPGQHTVDLGSLYNGMYFIRVITPGKTEVKTIFRK